MRKKDFYRYYLDYKHREKDLTRLLWPTQPLPVGVELNPDLTLLKEQQSNADSVSHVLDCFVRSHQRRLDHPVSETLNHYRQAKPGSLALRWLLQSGTTGELSHWEHSRLLKLMVHRLVAEGNVDIVTTWLLAKDAPAQSSSKWASDPEIWRGQLLSYALQAQAYWTQETLLLEESMQTYLSTSRRAFNNIYLAHSFPASWLYTILTLKIRPVVEGKSFDQYLNFFPVWAKADSYQLKFNQARLSINHPLRPDPLPALQLLQKTPRFRLAQVLDIAFQFDS